MAILENQIGTKSSDRRYKGDSALATFLRGGVPQNGYIKGNLEGANKIVYGMEDPTYLAFQFMVSTSGGLFETMPKDDTVAKMVDYTNNDYCYSALAYLKACEQAYYTQYPPKEAGANGEQPALAPQPSVAIARANLEKFINGFYEICLTYPYYLQGIEGLQDVYKKYYNNSKEPFLGGNDTKIKITCLESMDLRMTALFDSYFKSIYERKYMRMLVPRNLLKFNCTVIVHDLRRFVCAPFGYNTHIDNWETVEQNTSMIIFRFKNCVFDVETLGDSLSGVSNSDKAEAKFAFQFTYDDVNIDVCSLADVLQGEQPTLPEYRATTDQNMYAAAHKDENLRTPTKTEIGDFDYKNAYEDDENYQKLSSQRRTTAGDLDYKNVYEGQTGNGLFGTLMNFGEKVFNSATSSSSMGNVYTDGAIGMLNNMFNAIGAGGFGSYLQGLGKQALRDKGNEWFGGTNENGERSFMGKLTNNGKFNI